MYTLSIILDKELKHVLMLYHNKQKKLNFIGGKIESDETALEASYRELQEETGITSEDVDLLFLQKEFCNYYNHEDWNLYITTGVLKHDVTLKKEKNELFWIPVNDMDNLLYHTYGDGNCFVFLQRAISRLKKSIE